NHKYDTMDYFRVDPQYGTREELKTLCDTVHEQDMRLILDGVFNHMGRRAPLFEKAQNSPDAPERDFFTFSSNAPNGYLSWRDVGNLPELKLENPAVRDMLWRGEESVIQGYLRQEDIDGWRLDVAYDLGFEYLSELSEAVQSAKP